MSNGITFDDDGGLADTPVTGKARLSQYLFTAVFAVILLGYLSFIISLFYLSTQQAGGLEVMGRAMAQWFDDIFFQYNLLLYAFSVLIIPAVTLFYVRSMCTEKKRRLIKEVPPRIYRENEEEILRFLRKSYRFNNYVGSLVTLTIVVILGAGILLLLKPLPFVPTISDNPFGLDYSKGVNFFTLGPYMTIFMNGEGDYTQHLVATLTAFQFGFLGAYVYFIGHLVRSYFTLDLTPSIFVSSCVRMVSGSLFALVLSFGLQEMDSLKMQGQYLSWLPVVSFFIGFFPGRALLVIEKLSVSLLNIRNENYFATGLSELAGMSYAHEIRLNREGYDNIENLVNADVLDLALHTGFSYAQLEDWKGQACLMSHLKGDYHDFVEATGIRRYEEIHTYVESHGADGWQDLAEAFSQYHGKDIGQKIKLVYQMASC